MIKVTAFKNKLLWVIFFTGLLYFVVSVYLKISPLNVRSIENYKGCFFDSHSVDSSLSKYKTITTKYKQGLRELLINFNFKVYQIGDYNNIFQTAPGNSGIRMELANPSTLALIVDCGAPTGVRGLIVSDEIEVDKWYRVVVKMDRQNHLSVLLDDRLVVDERIPFFQHDVSDLAVGTGFSKTRMFDGKISDCNIELSMYSDRLWKNLIFLQDTMGKIFIFLILILIGIRILRENAALFHFFICSFGLLKITPKLVAKIFSYNLFHNKAIVFNDWALPFVFLEKSKDLFIYALSAFLLFMYYGLFFILVYVRNHESEKRFNLFFTQNNIRLLLYFFTIAALNALIIKSDKIYHGPYLLAFQCIVWILFFLVPLFISYVNGTKQK